MHKFRTHTCGELTKKDVGSEVKLSGWVHRRRDHGGLVFIDLRDHYGITQCVIDENSTLMEEIAHLRYESIIIVEGQVVARSDETTNKNMQTGDIELKISTYHLESPSEQLLPIQVNSSKEFPEETRLKYRFLDLRREKLHRNIILRSKVISAIRKKMGAKGFMEFQTPILTASSPEGARDYLVPSRVHPGKFYALPQAPQVFKQLIMVSGFDKYFQIAPCFRDEDARADRSPGEFYQFDIEMSYVTQEDVFNVIEPLLRELFMEFSEKKVSEAAFPRITYADAMLKYGSDKPDLRIPTEISDVTEVFEGSAFRVFAESIKKGAVVRAIPALNVADRPRSFFEKMIAFAQENGAAGLGYIIFTEDGAAKGPIAKFLDEKRLGKLKEITGINGGDALFFSSNKESEAARIAGLARVRLAELLELIEKDIFKFCWITDFPFFQWDEDAKAIDFSHNPFSMPQGGMGALENAKTKEDLLAILAYQYDIVCNGVELSSGAIRNHKLDIMYKAFDIVGYTKEEVDTQFASMINAFKFGAPPHGGLAPGVDRMVMLLADEPNIREVILFPVNQQAQDLMMNAPAEVDDKQLRELGLQIRQKNGNSRKDLKSL
jgi:aspartyl-tRNA synthetase